jgi:hypothetical protein
MRLALFLTTAALAASAAAQDPSTGEEAPRSGLSDLSETVDSLSDQPAQQAAQENEAAPEVAEQGEPASSQGAPASSEAGQPVQASAPPPPIDAEERAELDEKILRGRQLFAIARAGMLATQDMLSRVADPDAAGIAGWIAEPQGNAMAVTFYADSEDGPVAVYRANVLGGRAVSRETFLSGERPPLTGTAERMARARRVSESDEQRACTDRPFNVLVVPPQSPDSPIAVYRFSSPETSTRLPLGGHYRSIVGSDGSVSEMRAFTNGCLNVDIGEIPAGARAGPIALTHLLDPLPTEAHVFLSLLSGRPLVVASGDPTRLFLVAGDSVREMRR